MMLSMTGQTVSHYKILEKLGEGGMGVVYKAEDTKLHRSVALKFLPPEFTRDQQAKSRFIREAQAASALDHPNIAVVHEIDETIDGHSFICMAYYQGETLKEKIRRGPLPVDDAVRIAIQIADGLERAHEAGIVHRDIKPANVIVTDRGEAKIVDFGIAKLAGQTKVTRDGRTAGTAAYMSPEQALGGNVDSRSDLFSLGIVLYEMVIGRPPFQAEHDAALLYTIVNVDPTPPSTLRAELSQELEQIIFRLLEKEPGKRFESAGEARKALRNSIGITESTRRRPIQPDLSRARNIALPLLIGIVALLLFVTPIRNTVERWLGISKVIQKHLVVLPFTNVGNDSTNQAFCDGLMETLTSQLTQMQVSPGSFWVVASSEVRKQNITSPAEGHRAFGATLAITGSIQRQAKDVRVILNLVDAKTSHQLRSVVLDSRTATLSRLQDDAVIKLSEMLDVRLRSQELHALTAGGTAVSKAYDFYLQARGYLQRFEKLENIKIAIGLFARAISQDSSYALAYAGLGEAYWREFELTKDLQWTDDAIENCRRALALNERLSPTHVTLGIIYVGTGRYEAAVQEFRRALEIDSLNHDAYRELAKAYESLGEVVRAEKTYKKAIDLKPTYWANHNNLGRFYYLRGRYEEAAKKFEDVVALTPDNTRGWNNLGATNFKLMRWSRARAAFERSVEIEPNYVVYSNIGTLLFYEERYTDAAQAYEKALSLQSTDFEIWGNLASAYFWGNDRKRATDTYRKAAQLAEEQRTLNPRNPRLMYKLAGYYKMIEKPQEAKSLLKQALTLAANDGKVMGSSAMVYEQLGERELALRWLEKAFQAGFSPSELDLDPEMKNLRTDSRYQELARKYAR